ncbi:hypothetical protein [Metabacillus sp. RGM 3146]|uniref:hypothetical protein n=1 Tax=Metabacillus sp. RGM 3146 TaxID=3401092 RepID=UPI003B9D14ED
MKVTFGRYFFSELEREMHERELLKREPQMADSILEMDDQELLNRLKYEAKA